VEVPAEETGKSKKARRKAKAAEGSGEEVAAV